MARRKGRLQTDNITLAPITVPAGVTLPYTGNTAPAGWLLCDGSAISRTTYAELFGNISTLWGTGDGSTTFNLPDLRGRIPVGKDNMGGTAANRITSGGSGIIGTTVGATGGAETHTLSTAQIPSHSHSGSTSNAGSHSHSMTGGIGSINSPNPYIDGADLGSGYTLYTNGVGDHSHSFTTNNAGSDNAHNNTQPSAIVNYIIKY